MILRYHRLSQHATVFKAMTGLLRAEFDQLVDDLLLAYAADDQARLDRPERQRALGGGRSATLDERDQLLMSVVWLRRYPTQEVLAYLFGVSDTTAGRYVARGVRLLADNGRDTMRLPDPGRQQRRTLDALLTDTPELALIVDSFEQRVQRPRERQEADSYYSGKKKTHTLKSQVAIDESSGQIVDVGPSVKGPTADITLLKQSGLLERLPEGLGLLGDLGYLGLPALLPEGQGAVPRRKPRKQPRPPEDIAYNRAFASRRVRVEHTIGRLRRYEALAQTDRHHRRNHTRRVEAAAGLVNRQIAHRLPCAA